MRGLLILLAAGTLAASAPAQDQKASDPEKLARALAERLREAKTLRDDDSRRALEEISRKTGQGRSVWTALRILNHRAGLRDVEPDAERLKTVADHLDRFSPADIGGWSTDRFNQALADLTRKGDPAGPVLLLARAYLDELIGLDLSEERVEELGKRLRILRLSEEQWGDIPGDLVWQLKKHVQEGTEEHAWALQRFRREEFPVAYVRAVVGIRAACRNPDLLEPVQDYVKDLRKASPSSDHITALTRSLKGFERCRRCEGEGSRKCTSCKTTGERTAVCSRCQGKGRIFKGVSGRTRRPIIEDCSACDAKGKWQVKCPSCEGEGRRDCSRCEGPYKAPRFEDIVSEEPCRTCGESGTIFRSLRVPCPYCFGLGRLFVPVEKPKARLPYEKNAE